MIIHFLQVLRHFSIFEKMAPQAVPENGLLRPNLGKMQRDMVGELSKVDNSI
jgi:hypothetical protein